MEAYAELQTTTNFSFLRGGSHPHELAGTMAGLGYRAFGVADRNTLAGVVRAWEAAGKAGIRCLIGCRLELEDGPGLLAYPVDRAAYGRLCRLLTKGMLRAPKGGCSLTLDEVAGHAEGMILVVVPPDTIGAGFVAALRTIAAWPVPVYLAAAHRYRGDDRARLARLDALGREAGAPIVAVQDVLYHTPERRPLQDVLTCIREKVTIEEAGLRLELNAERHPKSLAEIKRLFKGFEPALERTLEIADAIRFDLSDLRYEYPDEPIPPGKTPQLHLEDLVWQAAPLRLSRAGLAKVQPVLEKELALIARLDYARYFLTVHDIVRFAEQEKILCQGRGSAANSAVCFVLGITAVDPAEMDLLFERFLSQERKEPPDIDVDFEHERREEVIQYIYERYGRERAGILRHRHPLPPAQRHPRGRQGAGPHAGHHRLARRHGLGRVGHGLRGAAGAPGRARPGQPAGPPRRHAGSRAGGLPAPPLAACGRLRAHPRAAGRDGADRQRRHAGSHLHRVGQGRHRHLADPQGRRAGAGHADLHPQMPGTPGAASRAQLRSGLGPAQG